MNNNPSTSIPVWFRLVAGAAILWNLMGCAIFLSDVFALESNIQTWTEPQKEWARSTPKWIYFLFAISVSSGVAGSIFLLLRQPLSITLLAVSFATVLVQMTYTMLIAGGLKVMGPSGAVMPTIVVLLGLTWLLFSLFSKRNNWLHYKTE